MAEHPEVVAFPDGDGGLKMYCVYCEKWHTHGAGDGHRIAHCVKQTPYKTGGGYVLRETSSRHLLDLLNEKYVIEYSKVCDKEGRTPYHVNTLEQFKNSHAAWHWKVINRGDGWAMTLLGAYLLSEWEKKQK